MQFAGGGMETELETVVAWFEQANDAEQAAYDLEAHGYAGDNLGLSMRAGSFNTRTAPMAGVQTVEELVGAVGKAGDRGASHGYDLARMLIGVGFAIEAAQRFQIAFQRGGAVVGARVSPVHAPIVQGILERHGGHAARSGGVSPPAMPPARGAQIKDL